MACCPFHEDRHPSMKLYEDHFYCFACGAHGDVIDLTAGLLGVSSAEAVQRLAADFGIVPGDNPPVAKPHLAQFQKEELLCLAVLTDYARLLRSWKRDYAPEAEDEQLEDRYVQACQELDYVESLIDFLHESSLEEQIRAVNLMLDDGLIEGLRQTLEEERYHAETA